VASEVNMNCIPKHARCENCGNPYRSEQICSAPFHIVTVSESVRKCAEVNRAVAVLERMVR
jgi:hypothetical protein